MSKSAKSEKNFISLMDDKKTVEKKIKSAVTDSQGTIKYDEKRKGLANLITIYSLVTGQTNNQIEESYKGKGYKEFKEDLAQHVNGFLEPLQNKIKTYLSDETELRNILDQGAKKTQILAEQKMKDVREKIGVY